MVAVSPPAACEVEKAIVAEASVAQSMAVSSGAAEAQGDLAASGQAEACPASTTKAGEEQTAEEAAGAGGPASVAGAVFFLWQARVQERGRRQTPGRRRGQQRMQAPGLR